VDRISGDQDTEDKRLAEYPDPMRLRDATEFCRVSIANLYLMISSGKLKASKLGRFWFVSHADLMSYLINRYSRERLVVNGQKVFDWEAGRISVESVRQLAQESLKRPIGIQTVYNAIHAGILPAFKCGKQWVTMYSDAIEYIETYLQVDACDDSVA
jgi:hypothetical protein